MSTLYELTGYYQELSAMLDDPEVDQESFLAALSAISDEIEVKADNYAKLIRNMEASVKSIAVEQKRLAARKSKLETSIARLKEDLQQSMIKTNKRKFNTDLFSFNIQKNGGKIPVIVDVETSKTKLLPTSHPVFKRAWRKSYEDRIEKWKSICIKRGVIPQIISTSDDSAAVLTRFFSLRNRT